MGYPVNLIRKNVKSFFKIIENSINQQLFQTFSNKIFMIKYHLTNGIPIFK